MMFKRMLRTLTLLLTALFALAAMGGGAAAQQTTDPVIPPTITGLEDCAKPDTICHAPAGASTWTPVGVDDTDQPSGLHRVWLTEGAKAPTAWTTGHCLPGLLMGSDYDLYLKFLDMPAVRLWTVPRDIRYGFRDANNQWVSGTQSYYAATWVSWVFLFDNEQSTVSPAVPGEICLALH